MNNKEHYNHITNLWPLILGENFHWGYFEKDDDKLETATINLIDKMLSMVNINKDTNLLDVGCGIGEPAFYIHNKYLNKITGISKSENGIEKANNKLQKNNISEVNFILKDAINNGFPDESFDFVWMMEMSHLIFEKDKLISEAYRTVNKGGEVVLCDLMLKRNLSSKEIFYNKERLINLEKVFGKARLENFDFYINLFSSIGMVNIKLIDISKEVIKTIYLWEEKCYLNKSKIIELGYAKELNNFEISCAILKEFYENGVWGYGIIYGKKQK